MNNNVYADKYSKGPEKHQNIAIFSIEFCDRSLAIIAAAQNALSDGDTNTWYKELTKLSEEFGQLSRAVNNPALGSFGAEMQLHYLKLSILLNKTIMEDANTSSAGNELIESFKTTRDIWQQVIKKSGEAKADSSDPSDNSEIGGLI